MAAYNIGNIYFTGDGVDKDIEKALEYYQKASELDCIPAFRNIGQILIYKEEIEEGMLNFRKAAMCGLSGDYLFDLLRNGFRDGSITKEEYAFTLRENQKACDEMKTEERDTWKKLSEGM